MKRYLAFSFWLLAMGCLPVGAQRLLTLDSCRAMALRSNKQLSVSRVKQEVAKNIRKSARTKYLPHVSAVGGYAYSSREISLLNDEQKDNLSNIGTNVGSDLQSKVASYTATLPAALQTLLAPTLTKLAGDLAPLGAALNAKGQEIVDAFHTNTHHTLVGGIVVTQPIFMGGAIMAMNRMADINEQLVANSSEAKRQLTLYNIDQTYWQVVSLRHKQKLAQSYLDVVKKLDGDVQKMIKEGVATRSEGLSVSVKVNEAEMTLLRVEDGLALSRMLLNQLCGLPVDEQVVLADEENADLVVDGCQPSGSQADQAMAAANRPELKMLQNVVDMSRQTTNILKAGNLPQVLLMGGWIGTNPSLYNGFQRKFEGAWNVGVMVRVPIWNWGDVMYKVRAAKGATTIATLEMEDVREKIELQVSQSAFRVSEAGKKLEMAKANIQRAEENLRTANLGFQEGVISTTTVMEAQTAWLQAQSQKIDAEIDVKLSQVNMQKALGTLQ
jgi:outer membrane protein TolC